MQEFKIEIVETLNKTVTVMANSSEDALAKVRRAYRDGEMVLGSEHLLDTEIFVADPEELDFTLTALYVQPQRPAEEIHIDDGLITLQGLVQGPIEVISPFEDQVVIICNEEGKIDQLPYNRVLSDSRGNVHDIIAGNFLIVGTNEDGELTSLDSAMLEKYSKKFETPERFQLFEGKLAVQKIKPPKQKQKHEFSL
ncbi:MAG: DUF3846 domain-containing protein [Clostridia bacterium]